MERSATEDFIKENFAAIIQDWPWDDTPEYTVFRHASTKKWFALLMTVKYQTLGLDTPDTADSTVDIINLKSDPDLIETLVGQPGILPAYHMNKRHWTTLLLDKTCPASTIQHLIATSYQLTAPAVPRC